MQTNTPDTTAKKPVTSETRQPEVTDATERIRDRAYQLYEERGREEGHAEEDWLKAESEILNVRAGKAAA